MIHVHVDVDDLWIYAAEYGGAGAGTVSDSVYTDALPRFLDLFHEFGAKATFFVVGRDLEAASARAFCRLATQQGHEIANHSFSHPVSFHALDAEAKRREITRAHDAILEATGKAPVGFRAPGYYLDSAIVQTLTENGYLYDSSILPTTLQPLFKLYVRLRSGRAIDKQFGTRRAVFASQRVQRLRADRDESASLYELPISVLPILRLPVHSTFSFQVGTALRRMVYRDLRRRPNAVLLFHAIDAIDDFERDPFAGKVLPLRLTLSRRIDLIREALAAVGQAPLPSRDGLQSLNSDAVPVSKVLRWS